MLKSTSVGMTLLKSCPPFTSDLITQFRENYFKHYSSTIINIIECLINTVFYIGGVLGSRLANLGLSDSLEG